MDMIYDNIILFLPNENIINKSIKNNKKTIKYCKNVSRFTCPPTIGEVQHTSETASWSRQWMA